MSGVAAGETADIVEAAGLFKRLGHPWRLAIVHFVMGGERSVAAMEAELGFHQPSLSQHLTELKKADILTSRRSARTVYYRLTDDRARRAMGLVAGSVVGTDGPFRANSSTLRKASFSAAVFAQVGPVHAAPVHTAPVVRNPSVAKDGRTAGS